MKPAVFYVCMEEAACGLYTYRLPHREAAHARGFAFICGARDGRTEGLAGLARDADRIVPFRDLTPDAIVEAVRSIGPDYDVRALMCHAGHPTRLGLTGVVVAEAAARLGLRHSSAASIERANNKFLCRQALRAAGVRTVEFGLASSEDELAAVADRIGYPVILKPPFGGCCVFVRKCANRHELVSHYRRARERFADVFVAQHFTGPEHRFVDLVGIEHAYSPGRTFLVERYVPGPEGSVELVAAGCEVVPMIVHDKLKVTEKASTIYEDLLITPPATFSPRQVGEIMDYARDAVAATGLSDVLVHLEFRYEEGVGPQVLEINPRLGGLYVDQAFRDITGLDPYGAYLDLLCGELDAGSLRPLAQVPGPADRFMTMFVIYPPRNGIFRGLQGYDEAAAFPGILRSQVCYEPGTHLDAEEEEHFLVKCWGESQSVAGVETLYERVRRTVRVEMS